MSAFFEWDTSLVEKAVREKLAQVGQSLDPNDYANGFDEWFDCKIDVPELVGKEDYTNAWDVNIECDYEEGSFKVTAYPIYEAPEARGLYTETSCWIALVDIQVVTIKVNASDLEKDVLDWAVTKAEGYDWAVWNDGGEWGSHGYPTNWGEAGPIIEREKITLEWTGEDWMGYIFHDHEFFGPTPLVAAMRCYVANVLGNEVEVPVGFFDALRAQNVTQTETK